MDVLGPFVAGLVREAFEVLFADDERVLLDADEDPAVAPLPAVPPVPLVPPDAVDPPPAVLRALGLVGAVVPGAVVAGGVVVRVLVGGAVAVGADAADGWVLVTDEGGHPLGWLRPDEVPGATVTQESLALGGTLAVVGGPLRGALDAALSSPSRRGVVVDSSGVLVGTCRATEVLEVIESRDRPGVSAQAGGT